MQPWEFVVVKEADLKAKIVQYVEEDYAVARQMEKTRNPIYASTLRERLAASDRFDYTKAPVFILVFGDTRTIPGLPLVVQYTEQRRRYTFQAGLANSLLYMHLAATSLGLATRWMSAVRPRGPIA